MKQKKETVILNLDNDMFIYKRHIWGSFQDVLKNEKEFIIKLAEEYEVKLYTKKNKTTIEDVLAQYGLNKYFKSVITTKPRKYLYIKYYTPYAFTSQAFLGKPPA